MNKTLQDRLVKELWLQGICNMDDGNRYLPSFVDAFNQRFARALLNTKIAHRALESNIDLDEVFCWQEERTVRNSLSIQYDRVVYLLDKAQINKDLRRKKVTVFDYSDGTIAVKYKGLPLPYTIYDEVTQVNQGEIVSNKRLGHVLAFAKEEQEKRSFTRSQSAPTRKAQRANKSRQTNPAV
jgi:hypothetical protein